MVVLVMVKPVNDGKLNEGKCGDDINATGADNDAGGGDVRRCWKI